MTLRELRAAHRELFHPNQDWFEEEAFMDREFPGEPTMPTEVAPWGLRALAYPLIMVPTLALAQLYVLHPTDPLWQRYLFTSDLDAHEQRVFVGDNGKGFEIHRHIRITERFGIPVW